MCSLGLQPRKRKWRRRGRRRKRRRGHNSKHYVLTAGVWRFCHLLFFRTLHFTLKLECFLLHINNDRYIFSLICLWVNRTINQSIDRWMIRSSPECWELKREVQFEHTKQWIIITSFCYRVHTSRNNSVYIKRIRRLDSSFFFAMPALNIDIYFFCIKTTGVLLKTQRPNHWRGKQRGKVCPPKGREVCAKRVHARYTTVTRNKKHTTYGDQHIQNDDKKT